MLLAPGAAVNVSPEVTLYNTTPHRSMRLNGAQGPNRTYMQGPRTRVYVTTRSWLDAGTEVQPGDRKFTDYAYPPDIGYPSFARENNNRPIDRSPLSPPSDLGGYPRTFPLY